ncbi:YccT family protein [Amphritea sp. HPY]|uniref:YccT family protein n=1 Tax=Amphritea sp. HPY TaxID=3421652 RepID=UPI003D7D87BE
MVFFSKVVLFLSLVYTPYIWSSVVIELGPGVVLLAANGDSIEEGVKNVSNTILPNGINQLVVHYEAEIKIASSEYEIENSKSYVIVFDQVNQNLTLSAPHIKTQRELDRFNVNGDWQLADKSNLAVQYKADVLKKEGFQLNRDYQRELEEFNLSNSPAAIRFKSRPYESSADSTQSEQSGRSEMAGKMLEFWYMKADAETRASFKAWINQ